MADRRGSASVTIINQLTPVTTNYTEQISSWEANSHSAGQQILHLLPCTLQPAIDPYPEPDESTLHLPTLFP
jgi:hypothetical protein